MSARAGVIAKWIASYTDEGREMSNDNLVWRNDTILGICQAIADDFGFNPTWLRLALILPIFWFPLQMIALYLGLGVAVYVSRKLFRAPAAERDAVALDAAPSDARIAHNEASALRDAA